MIHDYPKKEGGEVVLKEERREDLVQKGESTLVDKTRLRDLSGGNIMHRIDAGGSGVIMHTWERWMDAGAIKHVNIITMLGVVDININIRGKRIMPSMLPTPTCSITTTTLHPLPSPDLTSSSSPSSSIPASKQGCILIIQVPR
jgi:hypothetical protein